MMDLLSNPNYEFLRPLCSAWVGKLEAAERSRAKWREVKAECMMFYSKSAAAMWDPSYSRKFWHGVKAPRFRITLNKAFEFVAVFGPNLFWDMPHRNVERAAAFELPPELLQADPEAQMVLQQLQQSQVMESARAKIVANLMGWWLNYTPREQPGGGLAQHSDLAVMDALIKGRGVMCLRPYKMPGSGRTLTGAFREPPENLLIDPDFKTLDEARWISIRHVEPHWQTERRFQLPDGSLREKSSLESSWTMSELTTTDDRSSGHRAAGLTNDLVVWYEIFSKTGVGARMTGVELGIKDHLENVAGDHAYICVSPSIPYPLNCSTEALRKGMRDDQVKQAFSWPTPLWADDRWPIEVLDMYPDPECAWPIPPISPGLGELKFLNFLVPWLANRVYSSSRDFWAVAGPHVEHYTKYLQEGADQTLIPTPVTVDDVRKAVTILQQPETRMDVWKIIELVSGLFDKRVGLTAGAYGQNEDGTQNRTAEETAAKQRAVGVRPQYMQKRVLSWQSRIAQVEAFLARWFVTGDDVLPGTGPVGKYLWEKYIMSTDVELVTRQMQYTVEASSIRRPDRERDIANYQQVLQIFAPVAQQYGAESGNYEPFNFMMQQWAKFHDADLSGAAIPPQEPDPAAQELQQRAQQAEVGKVEAEAQKLMAEAQAVGTEAQMAQVQAQAEMQKQQQELQALAAKARLEQLQGTMELKFDATKAAQAMRQDAQKNLLDMVQDRQKHVQTMKQTQEMGKMKIALAKQQAKAKPKPNNGKGKK